MPAAVTYRGRIAPSPTGLLHIGHARTFWMAYSRATRNNGALVLRNEDLDPQRSRNGFVSAMIEDLHWLGIQWQEGPDIGGPYAPYSQSERYQHYLAAWRLLLERGCIYPCTCTRRDLAQAAQAPHGDDEPVYPGTCRDNPPISASVSPAGVNWRFRVPDGEIIRFVDRMQGEQAFVAGRDFGDFLVWRRDDVPAYQLAVVVDDWEMRITEVVRGADLLRSTARQILLGRALYRVLPDHFHCPLITDRNGVRLAKRADALSLRALRESGVTAQELLREWALQDPALLREKPSL